MKVFRGREGVGGGMGRGAWSLVRGEMREPNSAALHLQFSQSLNIAVLTYVSLRVPSKPHTTRVRDILLIRSSA